MVVILGLNCFDSKSFGQKSSEKMVSGTLVEIKTRFSFLQLLDQLFSLKFHCINLILIKDQC